MKRLILAIGLAATFAASVTLAPAAPAAAAAASPAWTIEAVPYPSAFEAGSTYGDGAAGVGPGYLVQAYNVGAAATSGGLTVTEQLPKGLLPATGFPPKGVYGPRSKGSGFPSQSLACSVLGRKITCTGAVAVGPGEPVAVVVPVQVEAKATGTLLAKATIEGGGAAPSETTTPSEISGTPSPFGFLHGPGLSGSALAGNGAEARLAGGHPYEMTVAAMNLTTTPNSEGVDSLLAAGGGLREAQVELPQGMVVNPEAAPKCKESELEGAQESELGCALPTQVGTVALELSITEGLGSSATVQPLFNMVPPPGYPAEFAFRVTKGSYVHLLGGVSSDGTFMLTASSKDVLARVAIGGVRTTLWGEPSAQSHDAQRGACLSGEALDCAVERTRGSFLTLPAACSGPLTTAVHVSSWDGEADSGQYAAPQAIEGCGSLSFEPSIEAKATTSQGDSPSGLQFDLHQTQNEEYEDEAAEPQRATAPLKDAIVTLPQGMVLNPSAANGREACSSTQLGVTTATGQTPIRYAEEPAHCPPASKLGTAEVTTPLLDHPLKGAVYLAKPFDNPFGSLLGIYIVIEDEETGIIAKLAGEVTPNPVTGRLSTTFEESPELPLEDVKLHLFEGPRGALTTPLTCGSKETTSTLTPWSTPEGADAHPSASFQVTAGCYASEAAAPAAVAFSAGTAAPAAGSYSPFVLRVARNDATQHITGVQATLPQGLLGSLTGVSYCPEAAIAQARSREQAEQGKLEQQRPSCPASSEVGTVHVTAGSGSDPFPVSGHAYLAGPYKGAPVSLVVIVPAVAGPFDLGTVVDRVALNVDEHTAQIHAIADPLPTIRDGIPLDVRSIEIDASRPGFTLNPTSCEPMAVEGSVSTQAGQSAPLSNRFQVGGCEKLAFKPTFKASTQAKVSRKDGAALKVSVTQGAGEANLHKIEVQLPKILPSRDSTLNLACTEAQFDANPAGCPSESKIGTAVVHTPILDEPLVGPAILVSHAGLSFPDIDLVLQADERGGTITIVATGHTQITKGITFSRFETIPDAPITSMELSLPEGPYSILGAPKAKGSLCGHRLTMPTTLMGQNGLQDQRRVPIEVEGCSQKLAIRSHRVKQRTVILRLYVPAAGMLRVNGKGIKPKLRKLHASKLLKLKVHERHAGRLKTKIHVTFIPKAGKRQVKRLAVKFKPPKHRGKRRRAHRRR